MELGYRVGVIVDPQVDGDVDRSSVPGPLADDVDGRALTTAPVTTGIVAGAQRGEQPVAARSPSRLERRCHRLTTSAPVRMLP